MLLLRFQRPVNCLRVPTKNSLLTSPRNIAAASRVNECSREKSIYGPSGESKNTIAVKLSWYMYIGRRPGVRERVRTYLRAVTPRANREFLIVTRIAWREGLVDKYLIARCAERCRQRCWSGTRVHTDTPLCAIWWITYSPPPSHPPVRPAGFSPSATLPCEENEALSHRRNFALTSICLSIVS